MAELTRAARVHLLANQSLAYGPVTVPAQPYTRIRVSIDLTDADQVDPAAFLQITIEGSLDAGATWQFIAGATTYGSTAPERQAMLLNPETARPWVQFAYPPAGALLRATVRTQARAMDVGFIVEAW